jgi:uncharacterized repeat protein (TIGR03803 family)
MNRTPPCLAPLALRVLVVGLLAAQASGRLGAQQPPTNDFKPAAEVCALRDFGGAAGNPRWPKEPGLLVKGPDGLIYGTTPSGGANNDSGTLFRVSPTTGAGEILHSFALDARGSNPLGGLVDAGDGSYRGTTYTGGTYRITAEGRMRLGTGTVFSYRPGQEPQILHTFRNGDLTGIVPELCPPKRPCQHSPQQRLNAAASYPMSSPVRGSDGVFYGVASFAFNQKYGALYKVEPYKGESGITTLCINGPMPDAPDLTDARLRDMCLFNVANGNYPVSLAADPKGSLFGVTLGGVNGNLHGTVFRASIPDGRVTTIYRFDGKSGSKPYGVVVGSDGYLYGTALAGGTQLSGGTGFGVVYKMTKDGILTPLHTFSGRLDGAEPISGLLESKTKDGLTYFYGAARYGGEGRGVLYRVSPTGDFKVLHRLPNQWGATGRTPSTTMLEIDGVFYGTTYQGGTNDGGLIYRMTGVDLPPSKQLTATPSFTTGKAEKSESVPWPGQTQPIIIETFSGVASPSPIPALTNDGFKIRVSNCRNPHILQFIYREKMGVDGTRFGGGYSTANGESYQFTTDPENPYWHTDGGAGRPNPYYEQGAGIARIVNAFGLTMFDQPSFASPIFSEGAHETWRATFKDYVICNCKVVREIHWAREVPWIPDPATPATFDPNRGKQGPPRYVNVKIVPPTDPDLAWAKAQLKADGYAIPWLGANDQ